MKDPATMPSRRQIVSPKGFVPIFLVVVLLINSLSSTDLAQYIPVIDEIVYPVYEATTTLTKGNKEVSSFQNEDFIMPIIARHSRPRSTGVSSNANAMHFSSEDETGKTPLHIDHFSSSPWIDQTIRTWGCNRRETPLIFVHVGKAGGGMIRARFAAAALDYNRQDWHLPQNDQHYYPVSEFIQASFCSSKYKQFRTPNSTIWGGRSFEGNLPCQATTPIGMALACPEVASEPQRCLGCQDWNSQNCHTVYVGHNSLGNELHWLPPPYLRNWWQSTSWSNQMTSKVSWEGIMIDHDGNSKKYPWCSSNTTGRQQPHHTRPGSHLMYESLFEECSVPLGEDLDATFQNFWRAHHQQQRSSTRRMVINDDRNGREGDDTDSSSNRKDIPINYSPIYASLPVQRVTMVREPWSWLISKFFWHHKKDDQYYYACDDLTYAQEWTHKYALQYIGYLCGEDCAIRYDRNLLTLEELWIQSESNLRHAFSVVGLLNETMTFYEMLSTRVAFLEMSRNPRVQGKRHESRRTPESVRCGKVFRDAGFRSSLRELVPSLRVLEHLFHVAVQVNRFQLDELRQCQGPGGSLWSKQHFH